MKYTVMLLQLVAASVGDSCTDNNSCKGANECCGNAYKDLRVNNNVANTEPQKICNIESAKSWIK